MAGKSLWTIIDTLRRNPNAYPQVDIKYDPDTSATTPIILHIRPHIDLLFSGKQQRLHAISLRKLRNPNPPVTVKYNDVILSSQSEVLRRITVSRIFGPTYPGDELRYPGIWFSFDEDIIGEGLKAAHAGDRMQEVKRIIISQIESDSPANAIHDALDEVRECPAMNGELARAIVKVRPCRYLKHSLSNNSLWQIHDGVTLYFHPMSSTPLHIRIGQTTAQDLTLDLGPPLRVHYKEDERMKIHATQKPPNPENGTSCMTLPSIHLLYYHSKPNSRLL